MGLEWKQAKSPDGRPSSNIAAYAYDKDAKELHVRFLSGGSGKYTGVSRSRLLAFERASSKGQYLNGHVKPTCPWVPASQTSRTVRWQCPRCGHIDELAAEEGVIPFCGACAGWPGTRVGVAMRKKPAQDGEKKAQVASAGPGKGQTTGGAVLRALQAAKQQMAVPTARNAVYFVWVACGKPNLAVSKPMVYDVCYALLMECGGPTRSALDAAIELARKRGL